MRCRHHKRPGDCADCFPPSLELRIAMARILVTLAEEELQAQEHVVPDYVVFRLGGERN
jgi:hypothetical protein